MIWAAAFPGAVAGSWTGSGTAMTQSSIRIWCWCSISHKASPINFCFYKHCVRALFFSSTPAYVIFHLPSNSHSNSCRIISQVLVYLLLRLLSIFFFIYPRSICVHFAKCLSGSFAHFWIFFLLLSFFFFSFLYILD